ncbi:hypothetical protein [Rhodopirellula sp. P2]|uniref:hypothetical protein n=1 Tax=Rhodopirellula sp. P2 TaxID=2127060 RepID=UPI0023676AA3|nr:hypothetical protein [Rhodopirellula sp. P2]WDQ18538.1 hypothetical protein PSR62_08350 [Rhodopirellula sp. P2]
MKTFHDECPLYWKHSQEAFSANQIFMMKDVESLRMGHKTELRGGRSENFTFFPIAVKVYPTAIR